jgi:hypothetical protein
MRGFKDFFFFKEKGKKDEDKVESKNKEFFFITRVVVLVTLIIVFPLLYCFYKELLDFHNFGKVAYILQIGKIGLILISLIALYMLILLYKAWIIKLWNFFKIKRIFRKFRSMIKSFTGWFFLAEKEHEGKFDKKHEKALNFIRLIVVILMVLFFYKLSNLINLKNLSKPTDAWIYAVFVAILYVLIVLYKAWIKKLWNFLKNDSIVHYVFLGLIPIGILILGFQLFHSNKPNLLLNPAVTQKENISNNAPTSEIKGKIDSQKEQEIIQQYDEIIDRLNGFYGVLFTAITVIAAILALTAWRGFKEMKEKLDKFKDFEEKVKFVKEKRELAEWAQNKFDNDEEKKIIISSAKLKLTEDEKTKFKEIEKSILDETTEDSWLKMLYAKRLFDKIKEIKNYDEEVNKTLEENYIRIKNVYNYIEKRDLLKDDSDIRFLIFNYEGQLYRWWYKYKKGGFQKKEIKSGKKESKGKDWIDWWKEGDYGDEKYKGLKLLKDALESYKIALKITKIRGADPEETLGNLAVVSIELSKFHKKDKAVICLKDAIWYLKNRNEDFNTFWDRARATYYLDCLNSDKRKREIKLQQEDDEIGIWLMKTVKKINTIKDKEFFIDTMYDELEEKIWEENGKGNKYVTGFPGNEEIIKNLEKELDKKNLVSNDS